MKILFIGDPHLKISRLSLVKDFNNWIESVVDQYKPDLVVNLGDTFDTHAVLRSEILTEFFDSVDRILCKAQYVYVLGNHDMYKPNDDTYHALKHIKDTRKHFIVVDSPRVIDGITYVPYIHNDLEFPKITTDVCVAHQGFIGADYGHAVASTGVDLDTVGENKLIISGHIHKKHELFSEKSNSKVFYVGTPYAQDASDIDQIKGIHIYDTITRKFSFIESPLPIWRSLRFTVSSTQDFDHITDVLSKSVDTFNSWVLYISGPKAEILSYLSSKQYKDAASQKRISVKTTFLDKEKKNTQISAVSIGSIIEEYIEKVYSGSLDKDVLKRLALSAIDFKLDV